MSTPCFIRTSPNLAGKLPANGQEGLRRNCEEVARRIVEFLIQDEVESPLYEASVHRPHGGQVWVAVYTGPEGGQVWRSTGLTDRDQALLVAKRWEAEARAQRAKMGPTRRRPIQRVGRSGPGPRKGPLSQKEVALLLNLSERAVREIERRAIRKLASHPLLKQIWREYLTGELDEHALALTQQEIEALFNLADTSEELVLIQKVLRLIRF